MRRFRVRLMSGDEAAFELDAAKCIRDLKRLIASERALGKPAVYRQRLVLMPEHGGCEPHEVLADGRALAQCGHAAGDETELELVVLYAPGTFLGRSAVFPPNGLFLSAFSVPNGIFFLAIFRSISDVKGGRLR